MSDSSIAQPSMTWLIFALMTVVSWGLYGIFLHTGQVAMADPVHGRYKAFLFVGLAYFLTAVLAPFVMQLQPFSGRVEFGCIQVSTDGNHLFKAIDSTGMPARPAADVQYAVTRLDSQFFQINGDHELPPDTR